MILLTTQEAIASIKHFLSTPLPYGPAILVFITCAIFFCLWYLKSAYHFTIKKLEETNRTLERGIADLEAQEAQVKEELEDLRKAEAILIHRNRNLEVQVSKDSKAFKIPSGE